MIDLNPVKALVIAGEDVAKFTAVVNAVNTNLPLIQKVVADLQKAEADKSNPALLMTDGLNALTDVSAVLAAFQAIVSPAPSASPAPAAA